MSKPFDYQLFGLEPRDVAIYETMLQSPEASSIRTIATLTRSNRGTVFDIIKKLAELGLVGTHYKNKRKYYFPNPPSALQSYAEEVQSSVAHELAKVSGYVSTLQTTKAHGLAEQFTQYYDGEEEIAALLRDVLETVAALPSTSYRVISSAEVSNHLYGKFRTFTRQRIKQGISVKVLGVGKLGSPAPLAQLKVISSQDTPASYVIIYGNKVAHISLSSLHEIRGVVITDPGVAKLHGLLFDQVWESLN